MNKTSIAQATILPKLCLVHYYVIMIIILIMMIHIIIIMIILIIMMIIMIIMIITMMMIILIMMIMKTMCKLGPPLPVCIIIRQTYRGNLWIGWLTMMVLDRDYG